MSNQLVVYVSTISSNQEMKKNQSRIRDVLYTKKIEYVEKDVSSDKAVREEMRDIIGDQQALPPQFCRGTEYLGDYNAFDDAVESGSVEKFLKCD